MSDFTVISSIWWMTPALLPKYVIIPQTQASGKFPWLPGVLNNFSCAPWGMWERDKVFGECFHSQVFL